MFHRRALAGHLNDRKYVATLLLILAVFLSALAPGAAGQAAPLSLVASSSSTYIVATSGDASTLDPALAYDTGSGEVIQNIYDTLVFYDGAQPSTFVPQLAESYELSADGLTWTFHIRSGVTFHDGANLNPADVAYTFQRALLQGGSGSPQWMFTEPLFGTGIYDITMLVDPTGSLMDNRGALQAWDSGELQAACQQVQNAIVADNVAGTVTFHLAQKWAPFLAILSGPWGSIMDKGWTINHGGWNGSCDTWQNYYYQDSDSDPFSSITNGTGPFKMDHWTHGTEIVLVRNDSYWAAPAKLATIAIEIVPDDATRFSMLQAGIVDEARPIGDSATADGMVGEDCTWNVGTSQFDCSVVDATKSLRRYTGRPTNSVTHAMMNFEIAGGGLNPYDGSGLLDGSGIPSDFFADVHIRKAFNYCFDWASYGTQAFGGGFVQSYTLALEGMPGYDLAAPHYSNNLTTCATELGLADLDHDGIPAASDSNDVVQKGFNFQIAYNEGNIGRQKAAEIWAAGFAAVDPKFVIQPVSLTWTTYSNAQNAGWLPLMLAGWLEDYHDPHQWYQPFLVGTYADRANMPESLQSTIFQPLINQGVSETDFAARHAIYQTLNQAVYDNAALVLLGPATSRTFVRRWVSGQLLNPAFNGNYYYTMYKPQLKVYSNGTNDGWILESSEGSGGGGTMDSTAATFNLGDNAGDKQYRAILAFNTSKLPENAEITKVTLQIRPQGTVGTSPFTTHSSLKLDIIQPYFSTSPSLELGDFNSASSLDNVGAIKSTLVGGWNLAVLKTIGYPYINLTGTTQFRLRFARDDNDDRSADYIMFHSGNTTTSTYRPTLIIQYHVP